MSGSEKRFFQVAGLSGVIAGVVLVPAWSKFHQVLGGFGQSGLEGSVWLPDGGRTIFSIATLVLFAYSILLLPFYMALYKRLKEGGPEHSRFGVFLGIGAAVLFGAVTTAASSVALGLGTLYGLAVTGQVSDDAVVSTVDGILRFSGGLLDVESRLRGISLIAIGAALLKTAALQRWYGWMSMVVGILLLPVTLAAPFVEVPFLFQLQQLKEIPFVLWLVLVGFRLFSMSKTQT